MQTENRELREPFEVFADKVLLVVNQVTRLHSAWDPQSINVGCTEPGDEPLGLLLIPFAGCQVPRIFGLSKGKGVKGF